MKLFSIAMVLIAAITSITSAAQPPTTRPNIIFLIAARETTCRFGTRTRIVLALGLGLRAGSSAK